MRAFDSFVMVDWSGGNDTGATARKDAIWTCLVREEEPENPIYLRNRQIANDWLANCIETELQAGRRLCLGFDFPFGYPAGFASALTGRDDPFGVWSWYADRIEDAAKSNNRFDVAAEINRQFGGKGPFWANALKRDIAGLPRTKKDYQNPFPDRRRVEIHARGSFTCWQLAGAGAVGSQIIMGLPVLQRLRSQFADQVAVWPFQPLDRTVAFVEIWPSLTVTTGPDHIIKDAWQVQQVALDLLRMTPENLARLLNVRAPEEGWILGVAPELSRRTA